jgi:hypothetical protein
MACSASSCSMTCDLGATCSCNGVTCAPGSTCNCSQ